MLKCRFCEVSKISCDFKRDVLMALNMIGKFVQHDTIEEIESVIIKSVGECQDFSMIDDNDDD
jgi:hypothetical protein